GTGAVVAIYLLVNAAYLYLIPIGAMAHSPLVAADAAQAIVGRLGVGLVAIVVMVATFSTLLGSMLTAPRIFFAMADDGLFFRRCSCWRRCTCSATPCGRTRSTRGSRS